MRLFSQLRISKQLGWRNCAAVAAHRVAVRAGLYERQLPQRPCPIPEPLNGEPQPAQLSADDCLVAADALLAGTAPWFSHESHVVGSPPDWFLDPASGQRFQDGQQHWSRCKTFVAADIKRCWELSRWGWAPLLARAWRLSCDSRYRDGLNAWSRSWCQVNPVNGGSNWLCGQEASMRLLHAMLAWQLSDAPSLLPDPMPQRAAFVVVHLRRIAATVRYAQAQDNNHWTSEAAALFIGGSWLVATASAHASKGHRWAAEGRRALERSVGRLVMPDGSFAQHSITYHRLLLDTLAQVELWRRWLGLEPFSERFSSRCCAATSWLMSMMDPLSGDGPNLGSNDGAFCYQLHSQPYRDFRPTLQLASSVFQEHPALPAGPWDEPLYWLGLTLNSPPAQAERSAFTGMSNLFADGGYAVIRPGTTSWALLRLPTYRFRPAHADPLHLDLWCKGVNLLRDGGSYAYNASPADLAYFPGIASHNSLQFDGAEPMRRLGRFLWGDWLQLEGAPLLEQSPSSASITAAYRCPHGRHQRQVQVDGRGHRWTIIDTCSGFEHEALLRWRLCPGEWRLQGTSLIGPMATFEIRSDQPITRMELVVGSESHYYGAKTHLPVLEVSIAQAPATITTSIRLSA